MYRLIKPQGLNTIGMIHNLDTDTTICIGKLNTEEQLDILLTTEEVQLLLTNDFIEKLKLLEKIIAKEDE